MADLQEIIETSATRTDPAITPASSVKTGGVDPLGLRQINFDLMDLVIPGINNVAVHVRPFVLVTWAWRRAKACAEKLGLDRIEADVLRDFVDRIEVIFAWSQFLRNPKAELPGRDVLAPLINGDGFTFSGERWKAQRETRRYSTSFMAPINYGPALRTLGWLEAYSGDASVFVPTDEVQPALDAFEEQIKSILDHPVFNEFGSVHVEASDVTAWTDVWALDDPTVSEQEVMADALFGTRADIRRRKGGYLMIAAVKHAGTRDVADVRRVMAGYPTNFVSAEDMQPTQVEWRTVQIRQLFRLSLEALLYWITLQIQERPKDSEALVADFLNHTGTPHNTKTGGWLVKRRMFEAEPTDLMDIIEKALNEQSTEELAKSIVGGLALAVAEAPSAAQATDQIDRLPVYRAGKDAANFSEREVSSFVKHVIESWVLAQHVYWSIGRALGDARSRGKKILRLKVILEEEGWTLAPGVATSAVPRPTPDRLRTAICLADECNLL